MLPCEKKWTNPFFFSQRERIDFEIAIFVIFLTTILLFATSFFFGKGALIIIYDLKLSVATV